MRQTGAAPAAFGFTGAEGNATVLALVAGDGGDVPMRSSLGIRFVASLLDIEAHDIEVLGEGSELLRARIVVHGPGVA